MMNSSIYTRERKVRFSDCDPAGIGFYPRLVEQVNNTVEDWFENEIGMSFEEMHLEKNIGVPTRNLNIEFVSPALFGDTLTWQLQVVKLGRSSIYLIVRARGSEANSILLAKVTLVWCRLDEGKSTPQTVPDPFRKKMKKFLTQR